MPLVDSTVANLAIPIPTGAADAPIADPTIDGLRDYLGFWIQQMLNGKLATMTAPPVADACPVGNRYSVSPASLVARFNRPALFVWWDQTKPSKVFPWTTIHDVRERFLSALYVFDRIGSDTISAQDARVRYAGLISAVDAIFMRAVSRRFHPSYTPSGARTGTPIAVALGLNALDYLGGQEGFLQEQATSSARETAITTGPPRLAKGKALGILQGYPCLRGTFRVVEECGADTATAADISPDLLFIPQLGGGDPANPLPLDDRYLPSADALQEP